MTMLPITGSTAAAYASLLRFLLDRGTPLPTNDVWIAATALEHDLRLVTLDRHFLHVPQILVKHIAAG